MTAITAKVCVIGDFAVGKTSTIERFVTNQFSEKYLTTVGVKIDTKEVLLAAMGVNLKLVIWDVAGTERFGALEFSYLRGAAGYILVADGTRSPTVRAALNLRDQAAERYGDLPFVFLMNKSDLRSSWDVDERKLSEVREVGQDVYETSAKTGEEVENAILRLAERIVRRELSA
ncbi:MAG: GTP-binding protein [Woeseia sp.]|nr:GTP-binding protein [Woeseia sp.]MBT8097591.1 GTP-binding protein [Woeseia sp.]NNE61424.1 GTP-binding protein [Woeseia sp.]NNL53906.1 GTP-binding protein [Woeseia sp.]